MDNQLLYQALWSLREELKQGIKENTGRAQAVCTDAALKELARIAPRTMDQLKCIPGLGTTFIEKYGGYFLHILQEHHKQVIGVVKTCENASQTLIKLQDRLVNLSRRNRMLYTAKLNSKNAYDLHAAPNLMHALLEKQGASVTLYEHKVRQTVEEQNRQKRLATLLREVSKELRETGQADLYIAYPFVKGKMMGDDFSVRAPLCLFPVKFNYAPDKITVAVDTSQEILYNTNLILLHNKLAKISTDVPEASDWEFNKQAFIPNMLQFFDQHGLTIQIPKGQNPQLEKFTEYTAKDFPTFENGELYLDNTAVLGRYSLFSVAIQKDFKKMLEAGELNVNVSELLANYDDVDVYGEPSFSEVEEAEKPWLVKEQSLAYINSLNASQENAILGAKQNNKLVIQGPPGTGKSQTIISLIADYVANDKTVLMVSQKQAALNVIHSRLGQLSNFAVMLSDTQDKQAFYGQMRRLVQSANLSIAPVQAQKEELNQHIDAHIAHLSYIATALFASPNGDEPMYKLYQEHTQNTLRDPAILFKHAPLVDKSLLGFKYTQLKNAVAHLNNPQLMGLVKDYLSLAKDAPWLKFVKPGLTMLDHLQLLEDIKNYKAVCKERATKNPFARMFNGSHKKALNALKTKWFTQRCKDLNKEFLKNPELLDTAGRYFDFTKASDAYYALEDGHKWVAANAIDLANAMPELTPISALDRIVEFVACVKIDAFEKSNPDVLANISAFKQLTTTITNLMAQKRELTKELVLSKLTNVYRNEIASAKRGAELIRQLERQRLPSIPSFINKFQLEIFRGIKIWFMTPESVAEALPHVKGLFDLVVFDEASQLYVEKALPSITRGKHIVISGDHKQLRPSSLGVGRIDSDDDTIDEDADAKLFESNAALEEESLLDLARWKYPQVMLDYHYRSRFEELIAFSNYAFYNGKLQVSPNKSKPVAPPIEVRKVENGAWLNRTNKAEAEETVAIIKEVFANRTNGETVGVITFNATQRDLIMDLIDAECIKDKAFAAQILVERERKDNGEDVGLFIKNIENVQGDERDIIIFSMGYAKNEKGRIVRNFGWLNQQGGENRLNVGITRAKQKIYFVCSITPQELQVEDLTGNGPKLLKKYLEYIFAISGGDKEAAQNVLFSLSDTATQSGALTFDSPFEEEVYHALTAAGLSVDCQVGIGGYRIDMAVRHPETGEYLLGIECDGKLYHSSTIARERDIHRQNYLESRGWKIHRIWSTAWWHNAKMEVDRIVSLVNSQNPTL